MSLPHSQMPGFFEGRHSNPPGSKGLVSMPQKGFLAYHSFNSPYRTTTCFIEPSRALHEQCLSYIQIPGSTELFFQGRYGKLCIGVALH